MGCKNNINFSFDIFQRNSLHSKFTTNTPVLLLNWRGVIFSEYLRMIFSNFDIIIIMDWLYSIFCCLSWFVFQLSKDGPNKRQFINSRNMILPIKIFLNVSINTTPLFAYSFLLTNHMMFCYIQNSTYHILRDKYHVWTQK